MFECDHVAKADMKAGTLYAIAGEGGWIYYGQVTPDKAIAFFRRRDRAIATADDVTSSPTMAVVDVAYPSIGRALRAGIWKKQGRYPLSERIASRMVVQWPVGTLKVTVWQGGAPSHQTSVDDPAIQMMEIMAVWDAEFHIPQRLAADFCTEEAPWHVGGPVWRERRVQEERARRFPDEPAHKLPSDWVPTSGPKNPGFDLADDR
ncbi:hypothetical protein [Pseudaminobacter soli (ex Li et al. 2025)]|uniref:Uncharacterized protein n=1 Tax=Pseudaminobacter soli (ex Li et al. 2025) TaxID=1295366 RepID=A0A2P7SD32_9HYPH|nr:hypothetical protein [Mesorhizobium soli]PSJ60398.1 hypothetical protein C7I85_14755 [Mesorhizobium soli]